MAFEKYRLRGKILCFLGGWGINGTGIRIIPYMSFSYQPEQIAGELPRLAKGVCTRVAGSLVLFLLLWLGGAIPSSATVVPQVADLGAAQQFAVLLTGTTGGSNSARFDFKGNSSIVGDVGLGAGEIMKTAGKSDTVAGDIITSTPFQLSPGSSLEGQQVQSPALVNQAIRDAITFSQTLAGFTSTQTFSTLDTSATLIGNGGVNVINFTGGTGVNLDGGDVLTLSGGANDIFYLNFFDEAGFSVSGAAQIALAGGVDPNNIYWNIVDGTDVSITGGTVYGTLLNINQTSANQGTAGDFTLKNATLYGRIVGGGGADTNVSNGAMIEIAAVQQAPEASSVAMLAVLGFATMFSSLLRRWGKRPFSWA